MRLLVLTLSSSLLTVALPGAALAQATTTSTPTAADGPEPGAPAVTPIPLAPPAPPVVAVVPVGPLAAPAAPAPVDDHLAAVGKIGVGFVGARDLAVGQLDGALAAPTIAARLWMTERWGVEVGLGLGHSSGTVSVQQPGATTTTVDSATRWGIAVQAGLPIALGWGAHYAFVVTPEARLGLAWIDPGGDPERPDSEDGADGLTFELGARAGAELHFGFIGVPELALEASVGLFMRHVSVSQVAGANATEASQLTLGTVAFNDPWDFFRTSVAARYYF